MLMKDIGKDISEDDYQHDIYVSFKNGAPKSYRNCAYFESDGYTFIWTKNSSEMISRKEVGDYILIPADIAFHIDLKKVT